MKKKVSITKKEKALLDYARMHCQGEIIEPAKNDNKTMAIIVSLYNKKLIRIDFEHDKLFVNQNGGQYV